MTGRGNRGQSRCKTKSEKAGLVFPVARIERDMRNAKYPITRMSPKAAVYATAVLEELSASVLEDASAVATSENQRHITPHHIVLAIKSNKGLDELFGRAIIASGGVLPNINKALFQSSSSRRRRRTIRRRNPSTQDDPPQHDEVEARTNH